MEQSNKNKFENPRYWDKNKFVLYFYVRGLLRKLGRFNTEDEFKNYSVVKYRFVLDT